jgi:hypothetical protein
MKLFGAERRDGTVSEQMLGAGRKQGAVSEQM